MGAVLGCCGGPSTDYDAAFLKQSSARYHPLLGRCDAVEKSLLGQLQRSLSTSWSARRLVARSPLTRSHTGGSRYGLDARYESASDSDDDDDYLDDLDAAAPRSGGGRAGSVASATSGSRLLCDFYNLVLECDHSKFFVDAHGRRAKGAYLSEVEILEDYFDAARRLTVGTRRRRRSSVDVAPYQPPLAKLKHVGSSALSTYDRSSNMSLMSTDTDETLVSESDYWATFLDKPEEPIEFVAEMTFPPKYGHGAALPYYAPPPPPSYGRARRDSGDRRRSWQQDHAPPSFGSSLDAAASSLLLFSPVNATSLHEQATTAAPPTLARQRSSSRNSMRSGPYDRPHALPMEGSRYNLWDPASTDDEVSGASKTGKAAVLPAAFSNAAVSERRRASLTMGTANNSSANGNRRMSLHAVAPIAV